MDLSPETLQAVVGKLIILILSIAVHEFGHAFVADRLGDGLPRQQGRVTLNPLAHADPIGTLALPAFSLLASGGMSIGFGWGRPVQTNPVAYSRRFTQRTGHMFVAFAGPAMNFLFAIFIGVLLYVLVKTGALPLDTVYRPNTVASMMASAVWTNFVLMFFNLIPAPPLDGGAVIQGLLPRRYLHHYEGYAKYGFFVAAAFMMIPTLAIAFVWPATQLNHLLLRTILGF
jgi:Zn-dependent protease